MNFIQQLIENSLDRKAKPLQASSCNVTKPDFQPINVTKVLIPPKKLESQNIENMRQGTC